MVKEKKKEKKDMVWVACCGNKDCARCHGMGGYWEHRPKHQ